MLGSPRSSPVGKNAFALAFLVVLCRCESVVAAPPETGIKFERRTSGSAEFLVVHPIDNEAIDLFWRHTGVTHYRTIGSLSEQLAQRNKRLVFATNSGIFEPDFTPTGLHMERGEIVHPLNLNEGSGNFYLKPNGVFAIAKSGAASIRPSREMRGAEQRFRIALQSGPLLVAQGEINPALREESANRAVRSAVGVTAKGAVVFVLSQGKVTFHQLASFLLHDERCPDALYLDGAISEFHLPEEGIVASDREFAGIIAVIESGAAK